MMRQSKRLKSFEAKLGFIKDINNIPNTYPYINRWLDSRVAVLSKKLKMDIPHSDKKAIKDVILIYKKLKM